MVRSLSLAWPKVTLSFDFVSYRSHREVQYKNENPLHLKVALTKTDVDTKTLEDGLKLPHKT